MPVFTGFLQKDYAKLFLYDPLPNAIKRYSGRQLMPSCLADWCRMLSQVIISASEDQEHARCNASRVRRLVLFDEIHFSAWLKWFGERDWASNRPDLISLVNAFSIKPACASFSSVIRTQRAIAEANSTLVRRLINTGGSISNKNF